MLAVVLEAVILQVKIILGAQSSSGVHFIPGLTAKPVGGGRILG